MSDSTRTFRAVFKVFGKCVGEAPRMCAVYAFVRYHRSVTGFPTVLRRLHEGVFADVFVIATPDGERACKIAHPASAGPRATREAFATSGVAFATGSIGRFTPEPNEVLAREHEVLTRVDHPHVVRAREFGHLPDDPDRAYLVTDLVAAPSWRVRLRNGAAPTLDEYVHLANVIASLHEEHAWMHGDLKPDNVLGGSARETMLIDPSAGMLRHDEKGALLSAFTTPSYNPFVAESDVPALASMLAELVCGTPLVPELEDSAAPSFRERASIALGATARAWCDDRRRIGHHRFAARFLRMRLPRELLPAIPAPLEDAILRGLGFAVRDGAVERVPAVLTPRAWCVEIERALGARA